MWEAVLYTWETTNKRTNNMTKEQERPAKQKETDKPEDGKVYALTGGPGTACILNGNTWKESEVNDDNN